MATHSFNALLAVDIAAGPPAIMTSVGCVHDISGPEISVTSTDSSCLTNEWKTFMAGLIDGGEVTFTIDYLESTYTLLLGMIRQSATWELSIPLPTDSSTHDVLTFTAFVIRLGLTVPFDDRIVVPVTLKVTGEIDTQE